LPKSKASPYISLQEDVLRWNQCCITRKRDTIYGD